MHCCVGEQNLEITSFHKMMTSYDVMVHIHSLRVVVYLETWQINYQSAQANWHTNNSCFVVWLPDLV